MRSDSKLRGALVDQPLQFLCHVAFVSTWEGASDALHRQGLRLFTHSMDRTSGGFMEENCTPNGHPPVRTEIAALLILTVIVACIYAPRLTRLPLVGEETRGAGMATEMLQTGDWIVPRQQGQVFPERPPLTAWSIAVTGLVRGEIDPLAVRLPSVFAVLLTSLLIYVYSRQFLPPSVALAAGLIYASMGQVLQIGRMGESEALFTLLVSASLMIWHGGYVRGWHPAWTWMAGFGVAALAAYVKGLQAPVYFGAITGMYLILRRDWRYLFGWPYAAGGAVFLAIISLWLVPYCREAGWASVVSTWTGLVGDRFTLGGLVKHAATYPLETFACLLPWSPLLVALAKRATRERLHDEWPLATFLFTALLVAYPSVWLAAGAQTRYFMPLYPCFAVLIALLIERCSTTPRGYYPRRAWHQFLLLSGSVVVICGLALVIVSLLPGQVAGAFDQPRWQGAAMGLLAAGVAYTLWKCFRSGSPQMRTAAVACIALYVGLAYTGPIISLHAAQWNDPSTAVAEVRRRVEHPEKLVSLGPIDHRFAYYYQSPIDEIHWPLTAGDLPADIEYFVFMRYPGDTAAARRSGRGRSWTTTPGTLPFEWEEVGSICCERRLRNRQQLTVVLGRVVRPLRLAVVDATMPHLATANQLASERR